MPYANPQYLVARDWLAEHREDADLRIVEVSAVLNENGENEAENACYARRHIPGAVFLDVASYFGRFSDPDSALPLTWPQPDQFEAIMAELGIGNDTQVVIYASTVGQATYSCAMWCTRAWWILHHFGVRCAILNGSLEQWIADGHPVTDAVASYPQQTFRVDPGWRRGLAYKDDVLGGLADSGRCRVVNALPADQFRGESEIVYGPRKGHITGSVNVPMPDLVDYDTGEFVSAETMRAHFDRENVLSAERVITYCGGGGCATTDGFALALLGYDRVAMYDNSLIEWGSDPALPMTDPSQDGATG